MDLLGSIMKSMEKPPRIGGVSKEKLEAEKRLKEAQMKEKQRLQEFREVVEKKINEFVQVDDCRVTKLEFDPANQVCRAIIHDLAEEAGLVTHSFGIEDVDRRVIVWKKEYAPCEEEIEALKRGEVYDPEKIRLEKERREQEELERLKEEMERRKKKRELKGQPEKDKFREKYDKIVGSEAGIAAAKTTETHEKFGLVPTKNKQDKRSIEQILADSKSKKQKLGENSDTGEPSNSASGSTIEPNPDES